MCGRWLLIAPTWAAAVITAALVTTPDGYAWLCVVVRSCELCS